ncbi:uncharacterized protein E0L32_011112 [Thyridium curvatum]|uniref:Uncharacterized protein n=1 Tax=Thyridium curvatum TaxID=1093900 RepID=A0A507AJG8_9PEZI|nr:uncharacterized protein E0L32_011112 [Thyridium curvatum]TPX06967.1 hypothetical protein E0L32_011112 [Thyridium curvatum]
MYTRHYKTRKSVVRMDPDCAICRAPANAQCECEAKGLEVAIRQAEQRVMQSIYNDIRTWVREHAQDYILEYFRLLTERRKQAHSQVIDRIHADAYRYYRAAPHPSDIHQAEAALKRHIDEDWQASVQRYPEVLEYFYGLVELTLPPEDDPSVRDPPLSALAGTKRLGTRRNSAAVPGTVASAPSLPPEPLLRGRTPPVAMAPGPFMERRTPAPRDRRSGGFRAPPHAPPGSFYQGY